MYLIDYHTHSLFSSDAFGKIEEMVVSAISKGLSEIAITDHIDLSYPQVSYPLDEAFDYDEYTSEIERLRPIYEDRIHIVKGVEMGLQPRAEKEINDYFIGKEFDFVIGSTHAVNYKDLYDGVLFDRRPERDAIMEYFEDVYNSVRCFEKYNVYGHMDAVARYCPHPEMALDYSSFREIIDEILKLLIKKGKGIELNSSGYRYGLPGPHPSREILERYRELGGEIITVASDAHKPEHVAQNIGVLYKMLKEAGFKAVTSFRSGEPVFVDI